MIIRAKHYHSNYSDNLRIYWLCMKTEYEPGLYVSGVLYTAEIKSNYKAIRQRVPKGITIIERRYENK